MNVSHLMVLDWLDMKDAQKFEVISTAQYTDVMLNTCTQVHSQGIGLGGGF